MIVAPAGPNVRIDMCRAGTDYEAQPHSQGHRRVRGGSADLAGRRHSAEVTLGLDRGTYAHQRPTQFRPGRSRRIRRRGRSPAHAGCRLPTGAGSHPVEWYRRHPGSGGEQHHAGASPDRQTDPQARVRRHPWPPSRTPLPGRCLEDPQPRPGSLPKRFGRLRRRGTPAEPPTSACRRHWTTTPRERRAVMLEDPPRRPCGSSAWDRLGRSFAKSSTANLDRQRHSQDTLDCPLVAAKRPKIILGRVLAGGRQGPQRARYVRRPGPRSTFRPAPTALVGVHE